MNTHCSLTAISLYCFISAALLLLSVFFMLANYTVILMLIRNTCNIMVQRKRLYADIFDVCDFVCQSLHADLNDAVKDREEFKRQMQDYIVEVKRCQELLSSKACLSSLL